LTMSTHRLCRLRNEVKARAENRPIATRHPIVAQTVSRKRAFPPRSPASAAGFGQLDRHAPRPTARFLAHVIDKGLEPGMIAGRGARDIDRELDVARADRAVRPPFSRGAAVEQAYEAQGSRAAGMNFARPQRWCRLFRFMRSRPFVMFGPGAKIAPHDRLIGED